MFQFGRACSVVWWNKPPKPPRADGTARESTAFSLLTLTPLPTPHSVLGLSNLFTLYQLIKPEKIQAVFPNVETIL